MLDRAAAVAVGEVELAVEAQDHAVHAVVGVDPAEAGQERVPLVGLVVAVGVLEHEQVGAVADEDAAAAVLAVLVVVLLDGDAHRDGEDPVGEDGDLVGLAVAVGVLEDLDPVGLLDAVEPPVAAAGEAIVEPLGDPDPAAGVDVDVGRVAEHRLRRPEGRLQALGRLEPPGRLLGADLRRRGRRARQASPASPRIIPTRTAIAGRMHCGATSSGAPGCCGRLAHAPGARTTRPDEAATTQVVWPQGIGRGPSIVAGRGASVQSGGGRRRRRPPRR